MCEETVMPVNSLWAHHRDAVLGIKIEDGVTLYMHDVRYPLKLQYALHLVMSSYRGIISGFRMMVWQQSPAI